MATSSKKLGRKPKVHEVINLDPSTVERYIANHLGWTNNKEFAYIDAMFKPWQRLVVIAAFPMGSVWDVKNKQLKTKRNHTHLINGNKGNV
jgi:hypothetical protein